MAGSWKWNGAASAVRQAYASPKNSPAFAGQGLVKHGTELHGGRMRTVSAETTVRLYYLDDGDPVAETLFYGSMADAIALARQQPDDVQRGLWLATDNDVVAFLDLDAS